MAVARAAERVHLREGVGIRHPRRPAERLVLEPPVAVAVAEATGEAAVRLVFAVNRLLDGWEMLPSPMR